MSAVARLLLARGMRISGCDLKENELTQSLQREGVEIYLGHSARHLESVGSVIYSSAIAADNPEIRQAKQKGLKLIKRAEALAALMSDKTVITVTGMHGKTTTASLTACLLWEAGLMPTIAVGGILQNLGGNAFGGEGRFFVAEADESDGTFLCYHPDYSIITNLDYEHMDYFKNFNSLLKAFGQFMNQTKSTGCLFGCWDDLRLRYLIKRYKKKVLTYGFSPEAQIRAQNISGTAFNSEFDCFLNEKNLGRFRLGLGGRHNILNSLAVVGLGLELGLSPQNIKSTFVNYKGTRRRLQIKFESPDCLILDDYGHHPTEIRAALEAVRLSKPRRLLVIFQPHRYSRTKLLFESFARSFILADYVIITDIYPAGESPIEGVSGYSLSQGLKKAKHPAAQFLPKEDITSHILSILKPGDVVLILGAGDITLQSDELADSLKRQDQEKRAVSKAYHL